MERKETDKDEELFESEELLIAHFQNVIITEQPSINKKHKGGDKFNE